MLARLVRSSSLLRHYSSTVSPPRPVRGMVDRYGIQELKHQQIVSQAQHCLTTRGFQPIHTPILEYSSVFERAIGSDTDVIGKELYKFKDSSDQYMTMRPEGTAAVARAVISNGLDDKLPLKLYYWGPMFRHERPQKGRLRQFEQIGIEVLGAAHPAVDVECIEAGWQILQDLKIQNLNLHINTLGDKESRNAFKSALCQYFDDYKSSLSEDSQRRLTTNPLRILDSKNTADIAICNDAPAYKDYLTTASRLHFDFVCRGLENLRIPYTIDGNLVRGLDYYQHTVWEATCTSESLGKSQATVLAGGRYDGLTKSLGNSKSLPGVGWAAGIERLALVIPDQKIKRPVSPIPILLIPERPSKDSPRLVNDNVYLYAMQVTQLLLKHGQGAFVMHGSLADSQANIAVNHPNLNKQIANALSTENSPNKILIIGSSEFEQKTVVIRDTESQKQTTVCVDDILSAIQ